jgi:hypothetical protein
MIQADLIHPDLESYPTGDGRAAKLKKRKTLQGSVKWEGKEMTSKLWCDLNESAWRLFMSAVEDPDMRPSVENALSLKGTSIEKLHRLLVRAYYDYWEWQKWLSYEIDQRQQRGDWYARQFIYPRLCDGSVSVVEEESGEDHDYSE